MIKARKAYGDRVILDDVTLSFLPGAKIGVVGPNGMGKSTLLKIMAGLDTVSNGEAYLTPGFTVGILQQEPPLDDTKTVGENIKMAFGPIAEKVARFNQIGEEMANPDADFDALMEEMGKLQNDIDAANGWDLDSQLEQAMDALQCPDPDTPVSVCSGGERRRVALCKLLLEAPDLLLLDEPTNHLDAESILWLEQFLHQYKGAVIAVTHDRYFMDNVAEWICEVDRGHLYPYKGNYSTYLETKAKRMEIQGAKDAKLAKRLKSELDWVRSSPKARQAKNKARLERYDQMEQEARNNKKLDFSEIQIPAGPRLGSTVLEAEHIHKAFGDRVLIDDLSFTLPRNGIVGVIGPNGVGKSTLFKTIVGLEPLTSGSLKIGDTVKISYVDQNRAGLDPNKNLWEAVSDGLDFIEVAGVEVPTRAYVASFGAFTKASYSAPQEVKNALGHFAYILEGIKSLDSLRPYHCRITADEETIEGDFIFGSVCNSTSLGGLVKLDPNRVRMDDGVFELVLLRMPRTLLDLTNLLVALNQMQYDDPGIFFRHASRVTVETADDIPWSLDGEYAPSSPVVNIENCHGAVRLLVKKPEGTE